MIEQIPLSLILYDRVVGGPSNDGLQDNTLIGEGAVRIVTNGVAKEMAVASRVGEIVFAVVLMHPAGLEETMRITCLQGISLFVEDDNGTWRLCKLHDVIAHAYHCTGDSGCIGLSKELRLMVGSWTQVDETVLVAILTGDRGKTMIGAVPPLKLSAPESTEVAVYLTIVILEHAGVDRE